MKPVFGMLRTLGFGAIISVTAVAWQVIFEPLLGTSALAVYALLCSCAFGVAVAPSLRAAALAFAASVALAVGVAVIAPDASTAVVGAALVGSVGRTVCYWSKPARALLLEVMLLGAGLIAARMCGGYGPFGIALGLWSYCLVQSVYFLFLTPTPRAAAAPPQDAFDLAHQRALSLLERR